MKHAIARILGSAKFWTAIIGSIVTAGASLFARFGLDLSDAAIQQIAITIAGLFGLLLHAQGKTDQGKEAAKIAAASPVPANTGTQIAQGDIVNPPSPSPLSVALLVLLVGGIVLTIGACDTLRGSGMRVADDVVDCMTPAAKNMIGELAPAFLDIIENATGNDGKVDWQPVRSVAKSLRSSVTRCAFSAAIAEILRPKQKDPNAPQSEGLEADPTDVRAGYEQIRAEFFGGATFQLETGTL